MLANQKGSAAIEMIPILIVIAVLINYSIGFFGVIHTGILNSMAARNYAFETFQHRSNLRYFREGDDSQTPVRFNSVGSRFHGVSSEKKMTASADSTLYATSRKITLGAFDAPNAEGNDKNTHKAENTERGVASVQDGKRNTDVKVAPVWIKTGYGICLTSDCGPEKLTGN